MGFFQLLNKPYPSAAGLDRDMGLGFFWGCIRVGFFVGCFVALFLILFQPFGIAVWQNPHKTIFLIGYGGVGFLVSSVYMFVATFIIYKSNAEERWTIGKEIINIGGLLLLIALGNLFYSAFIGVASIDIPTALNFTVSTLLVSIFPVTVSILTKYKQFLKLNQKQAALINEQIQALHVDNIVEIVANQRNIAETNIFLTGEGDKEYVSLMLQQLLYIESADNYSKIIYLKGQEQQQILIRSTLKRLESQNPNTPVLRCHRAYIVNLVNIKHIEGNAQGYKLYFFHTDDVVPVSRNFAPTILEKLHVLKKA